MNVRYETLDVTNDLSSYFERKEEFHEFYCKVLEFYEDLEKKNFKDITFEIKPGYYKDYDDTFAELNFIFEYKRELTNEELNIEKNKEKIDLENKKIVSELVGKLSSNSIGSIIHNEDLRKLYLEGNLIVNK